MIDEAVRAAQAGSAEAVAVLSEIARDTLLAPAVRVSAARAVVDLAFKGREMIEMEERLRALESRAEGGT